MGAQTLLGRLHRVKRTGRHRWMACCPAHADKTASLSICETDDGRVLLHCFAECSAAEVLAAAGLTFQDIMPESLQGQFKPVRHAFSAFDALKALTLECTFIQLCAVRMANQQPLQAHDAERLHVAANRVQSALAAVEATP